MASASLWIKPDAGNLNARFEEGTYRRSMCRYFYKKMIMMALALVTLGVMAGDPRVENVRARQIPNTKDVEVLYDLIAPDGGLFKVSASFQAPGVAPVLKTVRGALGLNVAPGRNRRFVWEAGADWNGNVNSLFMCTVRAEEQDPKEPLGVQLWAGGPYWAECNVGASKPEECGIYFTWDDATAADWGVSWRMPTSAEFDALISNCTSSWTMRNGMNGRLVKGKGAYASKSIFLPAAGRGSGTDLGVWGHYWSSTPYLNYSNYGTQIRVYSQFIDKLGGLHSLEQSVRLVR